MVDYYGDDADYATCDDSAYDYYESVATLMLVLMVMMKMRRTMPMPMLICDYDGATDYGECGNDADVGD